MNGTKIDTLYIIKIILLELVILAQLSLWYYPEGNFVYRPEFFIILLLYGIIIIDYVRYKRLKK